MKYIHHATDAWSLSCGEDGPQHQPAPAPYQLLSLAQWHAVREHWPLDVHVGLSLTNTTEVLDLADDIHRIAMIALHFPKWMDGRAYSQAYLLRTRLGYQGELRATGEVLIDMLPMLHRTGFNAVQLHRESDEAAAQRTLSLYSEYYPQHYQNDAWSHAAAFAPQVAHA
ncbi:DUF934 domain-containing protein [Leptothrix ochracea]|uniref:DUF934 domain-containing protein n=1 Tax=Leptothrix ochracea TaxID=735331 RepID=UPI0034E2F73D